MSQSNEAEVWVEVLKGKDTYYYNQETRISSWICPSVRPQMEVLLTEVRDFDQAYLETGREISLPHHRKHKALSKTRLRPVLGLSFCTQTLARSIT